MKFFIGAKNLTGQVIVAEIVEADGLEDAVKTAHRRAAEEVGAKDADNPDGLYYRLTAVNEYLAIAETGHRISERVADFLEEAGP